jgi:Fe-S cluster assembly protein SufD
MAQVIEAATPYSDEFAAFRNDASFGTGGLAHVRAAAFERFQKLGWPSLRDEEWRYTNVAPIARVDFRRAEPARLDVGALKPFLIDNVAATIVVVNGRIARELSDLSRLPGGLVIEDLGARPADATRVAETAGNVFVSLNTALFEDAVVIDVAPKALIERPLHVVFVSVPGARPALVSPRLIITAGEQSSVSVVESYIDAGAGDLFTNAVTDVRVGPAALVDHVKLQRHGESFHLASMFVNTERAGTFRSHAITIGGRIARNDIVSVLDGEGAECTLNGLYVATGETLVDTHTTIDHAKAHCPSHEVYKGILDDRARAVFNGKILVRQDAQKTDAKQTNRALLLSDDAQINTKPQLEIFADDVKCTHGAAVGQLDEDALFYLRARGIDERAAQVMLIHAFAGQILDGIRSEEVREVALHAVDRKLSIE